MLVKLNSDQLFKVWQQVRPMVVDAFPAFMKPDEDTITHILRSLVSGNMECWIILNMDKKIIGALTTTVQEDICSGVRSLLIYTFWTNGTLTKGVLTDGWETLRRYAISQRCTKVTGYTNNDKISKLIRQLGGKAELTLLELEV